MRWNLSVNRCVGDRGWARVTIWTTRRACCPQRRVTRISSTPLPLMVPAKTRCRRPVHRGRHCRGWIDGAFVNRDAFAGDRWLLDVAFTRYDKAVGRKPFVGPDDHRDGAHGQLLRQAPRRSAVASTRAVSGGEVRQRLDRSACPAHRVVFQGVTDAEQEQQQRPFGPLPQRRSPRRGDEHEEVDLELPAPDLVHRFGNVKYPPKK